MKKAQLVIKTRIYELVDFMKRSDEQRTVAFNEFESYVAGAGGNGDGQHVSMQKKISISDSTQRPLTTSPLGRPTNPTLTKPVGFVNLHLMCCAHATSEVAIRRRSARVASPATR